MIESSTQRSYVKKWVLHRDGNLPAVELVKNGGIEYQWWVNGKYIKSSISRCTQLKPIEYGMHVNEINNGVYHLVADPLYVTNI